MDVQMRFFEVELLVREMFPLGVGDLVLSFLEPVAPWSPFDQWVHVPEYDSQGYYGHVPMCPIDLPMW